MLFAPPPEALRKDKYRPPRLSSLDSGSNGTYDGPSKAKHGGLKQNDVGPERPGGGNAARAAAALLAAVLIAGACADAGA